MRKQSGVLQSLAMEPVPFFFPLVAPGHSRNAYPRPPARPWLVSDEEMGTRIFLVGSFFLLLKERGRSSLFKEAFFFPNLSGSPPPFLLFSGIGVQGCVDFFTATPNPSSDHARLSFTLPLKCKDCPGRYRRRQAPSPWAGFHHHTIIRPFSFSKLSQLRADDGQNVHYPFPLGSLALFSQRRRQEMNYCSERSFPRQ